MSHAQQPRKRSYPCSPDYLKYLRERKNWTQNELALAAGYSERLINKAESGRPISTAAIEILAETLSTPADIVTLEDLVCDTIALAKEYIAALYHHQKNFVPAIRHILDDNVVFRIAGDPATIPFAGEYHGIAGAEELFQKFFAVIEAPANHDHVPCFFYVAQGRDVIVWGKSWLHPIGKPMDRPMPLTQQMTFQNGKLVLLDDVYDTQQAAKILNETDSLNNAQQSHQEHS